MTVEHMEAGGRGGGGRERLCGVGFAGRHSVLFWQFHFFFKVMVSWLLFTNGAYLGARFDWVGATEISACYAADGVGRTARKLLPLCHAVGSAPQ